MWNVECGLRPVGAIGAYAPEGMGNSEWGMRNGEGGSGKLECGSENAEWGEGNWDVGTELNSEAVKLDFVGNQNSHRPTQTHTDIFLSKVLLSVFVCVCPWPII